jgi:propanediol dehydratase small subunit
MRIGGREMSNYPLKENRFDSVTSATGKKLSDITIENVMSGEITSKDIKISKETLLLQGSIAGESGRPQLERNFGRASELVNVPDDVILKVYEMLRPNRATRLELVRAAMELKDKYNASECSRLILEAARIYEKRGILKKESGGREADCGS